MSPSILPPTMENLEKAARIIRSGGVVAFPTETVYGLGASALHPSAAEQIFAIKGRPSDNPLIVHLAHPQDVLRVAESISPLAQRCIDLFWPGPLTILFPKRVEVPDLITAGRPLVAVRCPAHPVAKAFLEACGVPVAAPSANRSGRPSPTTAAHVAHDFGENDLIILDGGSCTHGLESTVIRVDGDVVTILRPGSISQEELAETLGVPVMVEGSAEALKSSPGTRYQHYQPTARVALLPVDVSLAEIQEAARPFVAEGTRVGVWSKQELSGMSDLVWYPMGSLEETAHELFAVLRQSDIDHIDILFIESVPEFGLGVAIMNRLKRAAS